jgi:hypothetical protein
LVWELLLPVGVLHQQERPLMLINRTNIQQSLISGSATVESSEKLERFLDFKSGSGIIEIKKDSS